MSSWCNDHGVSPREMRDAIQEKGWFLGEGTFRLGIGTLVALPPMQAIKLDWNAFAGMLHGVRDPGVTTETLEDVA